MTYLFDTNIWIKIFGDSDVYDNLLDDYTSGAIHVAVSRENVRELITDQGIAPNRRSSNKLLLAPFLSSEEADRILVLDRSELGAAKFPKPETALVFQEHTKRKTSTKARQDAIHLSNSVGSERTLVSCDEKVVKTAKTLDMSRICYRDLLDTFEWRTRPRSLCQQCAK